MSLATNKAVISIAGISLHVESSTDLRQFRDFNSYRNFPGNGGNRADCSLEIQIAPPPFIPEADSAFSPYGNWHYFTKGDQKCLHIGPLPERSRADNLTVFNHDFSKCISYRENVRDLFGRFLDQFIMINLLSRRSGFLLHSAGVILDGGGLCFIGTSGSGKSTLLRLFQGEVKTEHLLSDDRLALRLEEGACNVYGTPWHGEFPVASQNGAGIKALIFIKHSRSNYLNELSPADTLSRIISQATMPFWDREASERVLACLGGIIVEAPAFEFGFLPDKSAVDFLKKAL